MSPSARRRQERDEQREELLAELKREREELSLRMFDLDGEIAQLEGDGDAE